MKYTLYLEHQEYTIGMRALRQYNKKAHKEVLFNVLPNIRSGNLIGETEDGKHYKVALSTDPKFVFVHGRVYLTYIIHEDFVAEITGIEPSETLTKLYRSLVDVVEGVPITGPKDKFKLGLYNSMKGGIHND